MALSRNERFCVRHLAISGLGCPLWLSVTRLQNLQVTGGVQGEVRLWEMRSRELVSDFKEHSLPVTQVLLYDDDVHAISCSRDKSFLCWDLRVRVLCVWGIASVLC
jgi:WD40 repeat protein